MTTSTPDTADLDLDVGSNTLVVTVTAMDTTTTTTTLTYTITVTRTESGSEMLVPSDWSLVPTGLSTGDSFRLLFLSSTRHDASSASIDTYNDFVQGRAANGHTDIQAYSDGFTVVGCTEDDDARDNTSTRHDSADRGVPIYWLNGNKVADEYQDFYDGSWDDEANDKNQSGNNGPNTSDNEYYPLTGCDHNGTEKLNSALGNSGVTVARPNSSDTGHGPLSSGFQLTATNTRPMYGLSAVFTVTDLSDATLSSLDLIGTIGGESITLSPAFRNNTFTYTALVANGIDDVTLTATKNESNATVAITGDADTSTPNEAGLHLDVGDNTLTVTVTADDTITTETYTVTVTRAEPTPVTTVPASWSLIPSGLGDGDQFRLIFLSSTTTVATATNIADYNTFIQNLATAGHTDIQGYSDGFTVVGCTEDDDARNNTETSFNSTNRGVPIYWLNGTQVADDYEDFYDGSWDDEAADKNELGDNGPNTTVPAGYPWTGCNHDGTESFLGSSSRALGKSNVRLSRPYSTASNDGPIGSTYTSASSEEHPMYGLSQVFQVAAHTIVPSDWSIKPPGLSSGDSFRLLFLSSTTRTASSSDIADYNTFIQNLATAGHTDIQAYSDGFNVIGCTAANDARNNTGTIYTNAYRGVPIYWLNGTKVADDYEDFYDGSWDDEAADKNELGDNGPNTTVPAGYPWTGCNHDGTESFLGSSSRALGKSNVRLSRPYSTASNDGPIGSTYTGASSEEHPMYGLSQVFQLPISEDATLSAMAIEDAAGETVTLSPTFAPDTTAYTAWASNRTDEVTLTATKNEANATVVITRDNDTGTPNEADLDLIIGDTTLTVTVTAEDTVATETYTITVTRATTTPPPTECPADTDWCATMVSGYSSSATSLVNTETFGYSRADNYGDIGSTTLSHAGTNYEVEEVSQRKATEISTRTVVTNDIFFKVNPALPDGTILQLDNRTLTVDNNSNTEINGREKWYIQSNPITWTAGQHVTASLKIASISPSAPTDLTATADGANEIDLEWTAPASNGGTIILGYNIQHSPDGSSNWTNLITNTGNNDTDYSDTGLNPVTTRYYRVFAINSVGTSVASNVANATTPTISPPARVTGVTVTPSDSALSITWTAVSDVTGYKVEWKSGGQGYDSSDRQASITSGSTTNYLISGLNNGTLYTVRVTATKTGADDGPPSFDVTGTPSAILPTVTFGPGSFTASENGATARVTVELSVPASVTIPIRVQHRNGATSADYSGVPRRLIFADGTTTRSFTVTAVDDSDNDDGEKLRIEFYDLPAGFEAGARSSITVKLKDNDGGNSLPLFDPANELRNLIENTAREPGRGLTHHGYRRRRRQPQLHLRRAGHGPFHVRSRNRSAPNQIRPDLRLRDPRAIRRKGHRR